MVENILIDILQSAVRGITLFQHIAHLAMTDNAGVVFKPDFVRQRLNCQQF